jgi:hypothetical protein
MKENLPAIVTLSSEASYAETYDNHAVANVNDHVVRISTMTQPYHWRGISIRTTSSPGLGFI